MTYNNEYITTKLRETLGKMTILPLGRLYQIRCFLIFELDENKLYNYINQIICNF
ncbi:UNVERIFIED_CONTAM: hypothetical protein Cloal_0579 [Acetivibrio alkalicellulosi]